MFVGKTKESVFQASGNCCVFRYSTVQIGGTELRRLKRRDGESNTEVGRHLWWRPLLGGRIIGRVDSGRPRGTTPADVERLHCLTGQKKQSADSERNRQTHDTGDWTTNDITPCRGREDCTRGGLFCTTLPCAELYIPLIACVRPEKAISLWKPGTPELERNNGYGDGVLFTDEEQIQFE
ncbi:hypothetical protein TNCV_1271381 [Trichonephila clavipes]|nr:hypothetical protein TNCV_1271381 [Trichonephila clavipes]